MLGKSPSKDYWNYASRSARILFFVAFLFLIFIVYSIWQADFVGQGVIFTAINMTIMSGFWLVLWQLFKRRKRVVIPVSYTAFTIMLIINFINIAMGYMVSVVVVLLIVYFFYLVYRIQKQDKNIEPTAI